MRDKERGREGLVDVDVGGRRISAASLPSLGAILCTFFLPMLQSCDDVISPAQASIDDGLPTAAALLIVPVYVATAITLFVTCHALLRGPGRWGAGAVLVSLVSMWVVNVTAVGAYLWEEGLALDPITAAFAPATLLAGLLVLGTVRGGWLASALRLAAWWVLLLDTPLTFQAVYSVFSDPPWPVGVALWLAAIALWPVAAVSAATVTLLQYAAPRPATPG